MPCTGPNQPTDEFVEKAFQDVLNTLKEKHHIDFDPQSAYMAESRTQCFEEFRASLKSLIYQYYCETW